MKKLFLIVFILLIIAGLYVWSLWPGTTIMEEKWIKWRLNAAVPISEPKTEWEKRGQYLATVSGCAMCHTPYSWIGPHGSKAFQGGMRVRWNNALGDRVSLNLTPDPETGIGNWTERDFIIAMKSGIYPDGKVAHWQAMPWDMHSNWSVDDMRAMYRYFMSLEPKVQKEPNVIDEPYPEPDTFYFGT